MVAFKGHEAKNAFDKVAHVAKATSLGAVSEQGNVFALKSLNNKITNHPPVVGMHAGAVGVEDSHHSNVELVLAVIVKEKRLGAAFALVITTARPNGVHVAPIGFFLRVLVRVPINLAGACLENPGPCALGQPQHVNGPMHTGFCGLNRVMLVVHRACRAGHVEDTVDLKVDGEGDVVPYQLEQGMVQKVFDVGFCARKKVIKANNIVTLIDEPIDKVRAKKAGATRNQSSQPLVISHKFRGFVKLSATLQHLLRLTI